MKLQPDTTAMQEEEQDREQIEDLATLLSSLQELQVNWQGLKASGKMADIKQFGQKVQELGQQHQARIISNYGEKLIRLAAEFEIISLNKGLQKFPELVAAIASKQNTDKGT